MALPGFRYIQNSTPPAIANAINANTPKIFAPDPRALARDRRGRFFNRRC